jgi:hypothetical protein
VTRWHGMAIERLCLSESHAEKVAREIDIDAVQMRKDHLLAWGHMTPHDSCSEVRLKCGGVVLQTEVNRPRMGKERLGREVRMAK